jgi:hypothetical protein
MNIRGDVEVPSDDANCTQWRKDIEERCAAASKRFNELAGQRTGDHRMREGVIASLMQWYVHGKDVPLRG